MKPTILFITLLIAAFLFVACDSSSDFDNVLFPALSPSQATLSGNQQTIVFTVTGGNAPFTWTVADQEAGTILADGRTAIYTASGGGGNIVRVTDERFWTATATVLQVEPLSITANDTAIAATNGTTTLVAEGGSGNYSWQIQTTASGALSSATGPTTTYTSTGTGTEVILLSDGSSSVAVSILKL